MKQNKIKIFNEIYNTYYRKCFLFAKSYVHDVELADDFASEAMIKLWENLDATDNIVNIQAFLLTITKNLSLNYLRREKTRLQVHDSMFDISQREIAFRIATLESCDPDVLFSDEVRSIYEQTMASLPKQTRNVFNMSRNEDKTNKEIAALLGISVKGVDYHISKALKALRVALKDYLPAILFLLY